MTWAGGQDLWAKVTLTPANGVARPSGLGRYAAPHRPPQLSLPRRRQVRSVASGGKGAFALRKKIKAGRSLFLLYCFWLIIYPSPSAAGNFGPGHWARPSVRALRDTGVPPVLWSWDLQAALSLPASPATAPAAYSSPCPAWAHNLRKQRLSGSVQDILLPPFL